MKNKRGNFYALFNAFASLFVFTVFLDFRKLRYKFLIALVFMIGMIVPVRIDAQLFPEIAKLQGEVSETRSICYSYAGRGTTRGQIGYALKHFPKLRYHYAVKCRYDNFGRIESQTRKSGRKLMTEYLYSYSFEQTHSVKKIIDSKDREKDNQGIEYVQYHDNVGRTDSVEMWSNNGHLQNKRLLNIENNAVYDGSNLASFTTSSVKRNGDISFDVTYKLDYDSLRRLTLIEAWGFAMTYRRFEDPIKGYTSELIVDSTLSVIKFWQISYGQDVKVLSCKYEIVNFDSIGFGELGNHTIFYEYDKFGNWIKQYRQFGDKKKRLYMKRKIKYRKK